MLTVYRACLRLYPGDFRDEYGRELTLVLGDRLRDEPSAALRALIWSSPSRSPWSPAPA